MWNKPDDGNSKQVKKENCSRGSPACASGKEPGCPLVWEAGHGNPLQYSCLENPMDRGA